jgi:hypothetical protein
VFEVADDFSIISDRQVLAEQEGIFIVRASIEPRPAKRALPGLI